jgi:predicted ATP-grasp superfamily ATP-dependent carboligase
VTTGGGTAIGGAGRRGGAVVVVVRIAERGGAFVRGAALGRALEHAASTSNPVTDHERQPTHHRRRRCRFGSRSGLRNVTDGSNLRGVSDDAPLRDPALIAAFEGWNDAANASSDALRFLLRAFDAEEVRELDTQEYFDFQAARPHVEINQGVVRTLRWPSTRLYTARVAGGARDLVLALGIEPNLHWPQFCHEIVGTARSFGATFAVTMGALLGDAPHTRDTPITGTASDPATARGLGLQRSRYEGPTGIVGVLSDACRREGLPCASLWAPVPHYVSSPPNPKATLALLERLAELLELPLELRNMRVAANGWVEQVNSVMETDGDLVAYVHQLEARYDNPESVDDDDDVSDDDLFAALDDVIGDDEDDEDDDDDALDEEDLPSGETLAAEFERFLRNQGDNPSA